MRRYELTTQFDSRGSFGHKAVVEEADDGSKVLLSYETPVAKVSNGEAVLGGSWDYGATTVRHVKEFLRQEKFLSGGETKSDIGKMFQTVSL